MAVVMFYLYHSGEYGDMLIIPRINPYIRLALPIVGWRETGSTEITTTPVYDQCQTRVTVSTVTVLASQGSPSLLAWSY